jgi:hypothetical protein
MRSTSKAPTVNVRVDSGSRQLSTSIAHKRHLIALRSGGEGVVGTPYVFKADPRRFSKQEPREPESPNVGVYLKNGRQPRQEAAFRGRKHLALACWCKKGR